MSARIIQSIKEGKLPRHDIYTLEQKAKSALQSPNEAQRDSARNLLEAIRTIEMPDPYYLFMGFCPNGLLANRLDNEWREKGICEYFYDENQVAVFRQVLVGDLIVLKKGQQWMKTMTLHGHGRVTRLHDDDQGVRWLSVDWHPNRRIIEVPFMGATATVNHRSLKYLEENNMPDEFFSWLTE